MPQNQHFIFLKCNFEKIKYHLFLFGSNIAAHKKDLTFSNAAPFERAKLGVSLCFSKN